MLISFIIYFAVLFLIAVLSRSKYLDTKSSPDLVLGNRSVGFWLTAISAHASDMSDWLFMAFPAMVFTQGLSACWIAIGLIVYMFLNWHFIAPKIRVETEKYNSNTLSSYFDKRFNDTYGMIRLLSSVILLTFFSIYIAAGLKGVGFLFEAAFNFDYTLGILFSILIVIAYTSIGGFVTVAWTDFFQGLFLLAMIIIVPVLAISKVGGLAVVKAAVLSKENSLGVSLSFLPDYSFKTIIKSLMLSLGWGLGYLGMPHILIKFMGIKDVRDLRKSKYIGMTWQILSLSAATAVGLVGIAFFESGFVESGLVNKELVFIHMVIKMFSPFYAGFILCAILAAIISTIDSQVLVLASTITEDFYKNIFNRNASDKDVRLVYRLGIIATCMVSVLISVYSKQTIYSLVWYAWTGIGCSFGPLVVLSLYSKSINRYGAFVGLLTGAMIAIVWPYMFGYEVPAMIPGFFFNLVVIWVISRLTMRYA